MNSTLLPLCHDVTSFTIPSKTICANPTQANRPFEHEARLKELLASQAQLNAALDLDKNDAQAAEPAAEPAADAKPAAVPSRSEPMTRGAQQNSYQARAPNITR